MIDKFEIQRLIDILEKRTYKGKLSLIYEWTKTDYISLKEFNTLLEWVLKND